VQTFYNELTHVKTSMIDVVMGDTLTSKIENKAYNLIKEMALKNYRSSSGRGQPKRVEGKFYVDALTLLTTKMNAMNQKFDHLNVDAINAYALSPTCDSCGSCDHLTVNCQV